jgi:uncharacterized protein (TIGR03435 family)
MILPVHPAIFSHRRSRPFAFCAALCALHAQSAPPPGPRFEVASVQHNHAAACQGRWDFSVSRGLVVAKNAPLLRIISRAYNLTDDRITGPGWLDGECYDIRAKASGGSAERDLMPMLQELLRERFHLAAHLEPMDRALLALVVDQGGAKLRPYGEAAPSRAQFPEGNILFLARHLPDLCERLGKVTGLPVIDKTGLTGDYLIELSYPPTLPGNGDPAEPVTDIYSAVRDQLGLRLESQRGKVDVLKIESVDKVPTKN